MNPYFWQAFREALTFREFEPESPFDWFRIPWSILRWLFALVVTYVWAYARMIRDFRNRHDPWFGFAVWSWGRHDSPEPVICPLCMWAGMQRWCYHGYCDGGDGDSEPCDECPRCGRSM